MIICLEREGDVVSGPDFTLFPAAVSLRLTSVS